MPARVLHPTKNLLPNHEPCVCTSSCTLPTFAALATAARVYGTNRLTRFLPNDSPWGISHSQSQQMCREQGSNYNLPSFQTLDEYRFLFNSSFFLKDHDQFLARTGTNYTAWLNFYIFGAPLSEGGQVVWDGKQVCAAVIVGSLWHVPCLVKSCLQSWCICTASSLQGLHAWLDLEG